jgi:hypothetical protein
MLKATYKRYNRIECFHKLCSNMIQYGMHILLNEYRKH